MFLSFLATLFAWFLEKCPHRCRISIFVRHRVLNEFVFVNWRCRFCSPTTKGDYLYIYIYIIYLFILRMYDLICMQWPSQYHIILMMFLIYRRLLNIIQRKFLIVRGHSLARWGHEFIVLTCSMQCSSTSFGSFDCATFPFLSEPGAPQGERKEPESLLAAPRSHPENRMTAWRQWFIYAPLCLFPGEGRADTAKWAHVVKLFQNAWSSAWPYLKVIWITRFENPEPEDRCTKWKIQTAINVKACKRYTQGDSKHQSL